jgi:hypothetical protein
MVEFTKGGAFLTSSVGLRWRYIREGSQCEKLKRKPACLDQVCNDLLKSTDRALLCKLARKRGAHCSVPHDKTVYLRES